MEKKSNQPRKISRREMLRLTALTGLGLVAAQCAVPAAPQPAGAPAATEATSGGAPAAAGEKIPIRLVVMDYDENMKKDTQAVIDAFNTSQDKIQASLDVYSWGQGHDILVTQISGGQAPDLCNVSFSWQGEWTSINEVMPLDNLLDKQFLDNFVPATIEAFKDKGALYGLPYFLDPRAMYYRTDLFQAKGLEPPSTWDNVIAAGQALQDPPNMTANGLAFSQKSDSLDYWFYAWFGVIGADGKLSIWTDDGHCRFREPEAVKATQFLVDQVQKYKMTNVDFSTAGRDEELQPLFYAGKLAMLQTGSWFPTLLKKNAPDLAYGFVLPPVSSADLKPATGFWPDSIIMFKQTKNPEAATELLKFLFTKENRLAFAQQRGVIPARIDVGQDPAYAKTEADKFFFNALSSSYNVYATPYPGTYEKSMVEAETLVGRAVSGELGAEEAMTQAADFIDKLNGLS